MEEISYQERADIPVNLRRAFGLTARAELSHPYELEPHNELTPTIGTEIEIHWSAIIPGAGIWFDEPFANFSVAKRARFDDLCSELELRYRPLLNRAVEIGVPKGVDRFHEFAHHPANHYSTLVDEISALSDAGLVPQTKEHPLHITLGGVSFSEEAGVLLCAVEVLGGTTSTRLLSPSNGARGGGWSSKGKNGLKQRDSNELIGRFETGIEMRSLCITDLTQTAQTLRSAFLLGATLRAHQLRNEQLSNNWQQIMKLIRNSVLGPLGLFRWWDNPREAPSDWQRYAEFIDSPLRSEVSADLSNIVDEVEIKLNLGSK